MFSSAIQSGREKYIFLQKLPEKSKKGKYAFQKPTGIGPYNIFMVPLMDISTVDLEQLIKHIQFNSFTLHMQVCE